MSVHKEGRMMKNGLCGFSRAYFVFGFFVPLFRGQLGVGALHLLFSIVTFGMWQFIARFCL